MPTDQLWKFHPRRHELSWQRWLQCADVSVLTGVTEEVFLADLPASKQCINTKCLRSNYLRGHRSQPYKSPSFSLPALLMQLICYDTGMTEGEWEGNSECVSKLALYFCRLHLHELMFSRRSVWRGGSAASESSPNGTQRPRFIQGLYCVSAVWLLCPCAHRE